MPTAQIETALLPATPQGLARAGAILGGGGLVSFPTETVYGLGADARNDRAVARIYEAKGRPRFNPLIVHVTGLAAARRLAELPPEAVRLAEAFWPGPLTLVVPVSPQAGLSKLVSAGLDSVAIRVPAHPVARALLEVFDGPVAAPSANRSGRISPTRAAHVMAGLGGRIDAVVEGGDCPVGVESTIVSCLGAPRVLRFGGLPVESLADCLGAPLPEGPERARAASGGAQGEQPTSPGQLASHYAPRASVRLEAASPVPGDIWLGFGPGTGQGTGAERLNLSPSGDLVEAAANLFDMLHRADRQAASGQTIAVAPIPERGLGRAINDRLRRAAAPRPPEVYGTAEGQP